MQADFDDLRFNTKVGGYIDYWIEGYTASTSAVIWVELLDVITDPGSDYIWMYYGNASLSDGSNGTDSFIQYHGSATSDYLDSLLVTPSNIIYESKVKRTTNAHNLLIGLTNTVDITDDGLYTQSYNETDLRYFYNANEGTSTSVSEAPDWPLNIYVKVKITSDGSNTHAYIDDNEIASGISTNHPNENLGLWFWAANGTMVQDWSFVRKYIINEPTSSYGTAQHQRRVSQFIG